MVKSEGVKKNRLLRVRAKQKKLECWTSLPKTRELLTTFQGVGEGQREPSPGKPSGASCFFATSKELFPASAPKFHTTFQGLARAQ